MGISIRIRMAVVQCKIRENQLVKELEAITIDLDGGTPGVGIDQLAEVLFEISDGETIGTLVEILGNPTQGA
jgi:hypothetical protein